MKLVLSCAAVFSILVFASLRIHAQEKGEPGKFDFYLLNIVPASEFCKIKDVGPHCVTPRNAFVLHGLWPQNNNGTYPVFCGARPGPAHPAGNLDLTPNLVLLDHEWQKHGTCTTLSPDHFFDAGRKAFRSFVLPPSFARAGEEITLKPSEVLDLVAKENPAYPRGSFILWCSAGKLTSVSACLSKDFKPIACQGLKICADDTVTVRPAFIP